MVVVGVLLAAACGGGSGDPTADWVPNTGPLVHVTGMAFVFGPNDAMLTVQDATVAVAESAAIATTVGSDGSFAFDVPSGGPTTFSILKDGFHAGQSATLDVGSGGIAMLGFQTPTNAAFDSLGTLARVTPDPADCQIATTVSRSGTEPYGGDGLGADGAVVTIEPPVPATSGPIYFAYDNGTIFPDRSLTATSMDGGVIFANVPVGEYTLTATKAGATFSPVNIRCRAGVLVNAAPPNGLQQR